MMKMMKGEMLHGRNIYLINDCLLFEGIFKKGQFNGKGRLIDLRDGLYVLLEGIWSHSGTMFQGSVSTENETREVIIQFDLRYKVMFYEDLSKTNELQFASLLIGKNSVVKC